jgi:hypothetical protein
MKRIRPRSLIAALTAASLALLGLTAAPAPVSAATNLLTNPGFETGTLSGWTCSAADHVTGSPVHSGSDALAGAATASADAQCTQTVSVQPSSSYALSGGSRAATCSSATPAPAARTPTPGPPPARAGSSCPPPSVPAPRPPASPCTSTAGTARTPTTPTTCRSPAPAAAVAVAPYVDMTNNQEPMLSEAATQAGLKAFSAPFVVGSGCTPIWGTHCRSPAIPP